MQGENAARSGATNCEDVHTGYSSASPILPYVTLLLPTSLPSQTLTTQPSTHAARFARRSFVLFQRLIELGLVVIVFLSLLPPHWLGSYFTTGSNAKFKASVLMKHSKRQSKEDSSLISSRSTQSSDEGDNWDTGLAPKEIKKQVSKKYTTFKTPKIAPQGSTISKAEIEFNTVISQVRSSAVTKIIAAEELPMVVVPLQVRCSDVTIASTKFEFLNVNLNSTRFARRRTSSNTGGSRVQATN